LKPPVIREDVPLAPYTSLGVGGPARFLCEAATEAEAQEAVGLAGARNWPVFILGGGSNVLVSDRGFPGLVLRMGIRGVRAVDRCTFAVAAGEDWDSFVSFSVGRNLAGIECLSGIPGSAGGTPIQNVGAYGQDAGDSIVSIRALTRASGETTDMEHGACGFAYRASIFNTSQRDRFIIMAVTFRLRDNGKARISHPDLMRFFGRREQSVSPAEARQAVLQIRRGKGMVLEPSDPESRTAGSFFKNPILDQARTGSIEETARRLGALAAADAMPRFPAASGSVKIPAAWLIERAGFHKGLRKGHVAISSRHALAIVASPGATAAEILDFAKEIQDKVEDTFGVRLEYEPVLVGF